MSLATDQPILRQGFAADKHLRARFATLMRLVFDDESARDPVLDLDGTGELFGIFAPDGSCVAGLEMFCLPLFVGGTRFDSRAIRSVGVQEAWRGRGLARELMTTALSWCDREHPGPILLYTEDHALYDRYGFRAVAQYKVVGPPPPMESTRPTRARRLDLDNDAILIQDLARTREPVSRHVAVAGGAGLLSRRLASLKGLALDYLPDLEALIVSDPDSTDTLVLVDIIAARIPSLAVILAELDRHPLRVEVLFPPDRLGWSGPVERDDTGLMARGPLPSAFDRPFMLPPTAEF